jgi:hypothetical protein
MEDQKTFNPDIQLTEKQDLVFDELLANDDIRAICLYGSGRSGKTFLTCYWVLLRAIMYPGSFHIFIRATMTALTGGVVSQTFPNVFKAIEQKTGFNLLMTKVGKRPFIKFYDQPKNKFLLYNNSEIRFLGLDTQTTNQAATDKILSQEYMTAMFEEGNEIEYKVIEKVKTRLAQKCRHFATGKEGIPKWGTTLNPTTFDSWDYIYFQEHKNPVSKELLSSEDIDQLGQFHFHINDNLKNVSVDFLKTLESLSPIQRRRFLDGIYGDNFDGEIFQQIFWEELPEINEFDKILIYNDPSYKSGPKNDYKATGAIGLRNGAFWVIWAEAMQCTTSQMILNNYTIAQKLLELGWDKHVDHWFENAGMPDDFEEAIQKHADQTKWVCPFRLDGRQKGDKFARIESALVPLNDQGKLFFNKAMKTERIGSLIAQQFGNFKNKMLPSEHDDIPDMVHGGITLMNQPTFKPGQTRVLMRKPKFTL